MPIHVTSETGPLKKVLLHRPGLELEHLTPTSLEQLLFDDIPYLAAAQREHDAFADCLRNQGVEVVYLTDLVVGSLIKNPGGGLAPTGGYVAGRRDLVEGAAMRLTAPGIGGECGCTLGQNRLLYQGLFLAPHTVAQAVKTAVFAAGVMELLGYETEPASSAVRHDIIQMIHMREPEALKKFCKGIQFGAPVDSYVTPEPWDMPGYDCQVIMAAGAFTLGASIELSADAPLREPYAAWMQGGLNFHSGRLGAMLAAQSMLERGILEA